MPNPVAYFLHRSPWWFHRFETLSNHFLELVVPFFIFLGRRMCIVHGALQVLFQVRAVPTENLSSHIPSAAPVGVDPQGPRRPANRAPIFPLLGVGPVCRAAPDVGSMVLAGGGDPRQEGACGLVGCLLWLLLPSSLVSCLLEVLCFLFWVFLVMSG